MRKVSTYWPGALVCEHWTGPPSASQPRLKTPPPPSHPRYITLCQAMLHPLWGWTQTVSLQKQSCLYLVSRIPSAESYPLLPSPPSLPSLSLPLSPPSLPSPLLQLRN